MAFSSDRSGRNQIWQVLTKDLSIAPTQITTAGTGSQESRRPDWSSITGKIAYQFGASGVRGIHMIDPVTQVDTRLTCLSTDETDPSWSPDGQFIVYARLNGGLYDLAIHKLGTIPDCTDPSYDGQDYILLSRSKETDIRPAWSPDGTSIAFVTSGGSVGPDAEIAVVDVQLNSTNGMYEPVLDANGNPKAVLLTNNSFVDFDPVWLPDIKNKRIAFSSTRNGNRDIFRMNANLGECVNPSTTPQACSSFVQLTSDPADDTNPSWSPDGIGIGFVSNRDGDREIYLMSAFAGDLDPISFLQITNNTASDDDPGWFPALPPASQIKISVTILPVPSGALFPTTGIVKVTDIFGQPVVGASVTILGPLGSPPIDKLYLSPLGGVTNTQGQFIFDAREETFLPFSTTAEFAITVSAVVAGKPVVATGSHFIDVIGGGTPPPPQPPGPLPPSPGQLLPLGANPWTPQQKAAFAQAGLVLTITGMRDIVIAGIGATSSPNFRSIPSLLTSLGKILAITGGVSNSVFSHIGGISSISGFSLGFLKISYGQLFLILAQDPPDPNYAQPALPVLDQATQLPAINPGLSLGTDLYNEKSSNTGIIQAQLTALKTAIDRYFTAVSDGNQAGATLQRNSILAYRQSLAKVMQADADNSDALLQELQNLGVQNTSLTVADVSAFQSDIAANGFSPAVQEAFRQLGVTDPMIDTIRNMIINESPANLAVDTFSSLQSAANIANSLVTVLVVPSGPAPVSVPDVVGQTQAAAQTAITSAGLTVGTVTQQASNTVPSGSVIRQNPAAGTSVAAGSAVNLVVSSGPAPVSVPNVVGQTQAAAQTAITGAGLTVGTVTQQASNTVPSGSVISQNPAAGASVAAGSTVDLVVSSGPTPVSVPNVVGQTQAAAQTAITGAGLTVGTVTQQISNTIPSGSVISQNPAAGASVTAGSAVDLVVSSGPAPVSVPGVVGQTQAAAQSTITGAGLTVGTVTQQASNTVPSGSVISQNPAAGASVTAGSAVGLVVSSGPAPVSVPDVVGQTQAAAQSTITGAGLTVGTVTQQASNTVPSGSVISQNPAAGASVTAGSAVDLVVSSGSVPVSVPDVVGQTQVAAQTTITNAGLVVGTITTAASTTVSAGLVISQSPSSGTQVLSGSSVSLIVSSGPPVSSEGDYDIQAIRCKPGNVVLERSVQISVAIVNNGTENPGANLIVEGRQDGNPRVIGLTPDGGLKVMAKPGGKERTIIRLEYKPTRIGNISWNFDLIDGDPDHDAREHACSTNVSAPHFKFRDSGRADDVKSTRR
ncbi:MAG: PASTA domain-containing protein [Methylococcales bacterium]